MFRFARIVPITLLLVSLSITPFVAARAQSVDEMLAQIASLSQLIATLQSQIGTTPSTPQIPANQTTYTPGTSLYGATSYYPPIPSTGCVALSQSLYYGKRDSDMGGEVSLLQRFLQAAGDYTYPEITGYFGSVTQSAVQEWQARNSIVSYGGPDTTGWGLVGPRTRVMIRSQTCEPNALPPTYPIPPATPAIPTYPTYQTYPTYPPYPTIPTNPYGTTSCSADGISVPHGSSLQLYSQQTIPAGGDCTQYVQVRQCLNGTLLGDPTYRYASCNAPQLQSCTINAITLAHGESRTFYSQGTVAYGQNCSPYSQTRTCTNGNLSGSSNYAYSSCSQTGAATCTIDSVTLTHGESRTMYLQDMVPYGGSCSSVAQTRTCTNGTLSGSSTYNKPACSPAVSSSCALSGVTLSHNTTRTFYNSASASFGSSCTTRALVRRCVNGVLDGDSSYTHATCTVDSASSCTLDGATVNHGSSRTFYSIPTVGFGASCSPYGQARVCSNGILSGSDTFNRANCAPESGSSCTLDSSSVLHGSSTTFYSTSTVSYGSNCSSFAQTRTCSNGTLSGSSSYNKSQCTVNTPQSCMLDNVTASHGEGRTFYFAQNIPATEQCGSYAQTRVCTNGAFSGSSAYKYSSCAPVDSGSCALDNVVVPNGSVATYYSLTTAPAGALCTTYAQDRTCNNGVLSGTATYNRASCSNSASCSLDGITLSHGSSTAFYSARAIAFGSTCSSIAQTRTCTNGVLGGSTTYRYATCSVNPPTGAVQGGQYAIASQQQLAAVVAALEQILKLLLEKAGR